MKRLNLQSVDSTNTYVSHNAPRMPEDVMVVAHTQTGGRGQRGNSWEAEPGKNLTTTILWHPRNFAVARQFAISRAVCLAVVDTLRSLGLLATIKWPNDIYVGDRKIAGILIEHAVAPSRIIHTIIGLGLNINQEVFVSNAPNPTSVVREIGLEIPVERVADIFEERLTQRLSQIVEDPDCNDSEYHSLLWRADGKEYPFVDAATGIVFTAVIDHVAPTGMLHLRHSSGKITSYAFKEVQFVIL